MHILFYCLFILLTNLNSTALCMKRTLEDSAQTSELQSLIAVFDQYGFTAAINQRNAEGDTLLMIAASTGTLNEVKLLLAAGANINMEDHKLGAQPLWLAVTERNSPAIVKALLKARPHNIDHIPRARPHDPYWNTHDPYCALSAAILDENYALVSLLLEHGACIDTPEPYYKTPLKRAIIALDLPMVHYLLEQGKRQIDANRDILTRMITYVREQFFTPHLSPAARQTLTLILHKLYTA